MGGPAKDPHVQTCRSKGTPVFASMHYQNRVTSIGKHGN